MANIRTSSRAWTAIIVVGVLGAMHIWKLPAALEFIRADLGLSLVASGTLVGVVQMAGAIGGLAVAVVTQRIGLKNTIVLGMIASGVGSILGGFSTTTALLMTSRGIEGIGFIMVSVAAPAAVRLLATPEKVNNAMGWWTAYQGNALFLGVGISAVLLNATDITWNIWWFIMGAATLAFVPVVMVVVPSGAPAPVNLKHMASVIKNSVNTPLPWVLGVIFGTYTVQWGAILSFLPTIFGQTVLGPGWNMAIVVGLATAVIGGLNGVGSLLTGVLLQRGYPPHWLMTIALMVMGAMTVVVFVPDWTNIPGGITWGLLAAGIFSLTGAMVPTSVIRQAVDSAPPGGSSAAVVGLITQVFNVGSVGGPILLSALVAAAGTWQISWTMMVAASTLGIVLIWIFVPRGKQ